MPKPRDTHDEQVRLAAALSLLRHNPISDRPLRGPASIAAESRAVALELRADGVEIEDQHCATDAAELFEMLAARCREAIGKLPRRAGSQTVVGDHNVVAGGDIRVGA